MSATEENMGRASSEDDRKLFVGGLPQEASENDLKEYFEAYGSVTSTVLKMDQMTGRSRGFCLCGVRDAGVPGVCPGARACREGEEGGVQEGHGQAGQSLRGQVFRWVHHGRGYQIAFLSRIPQRNYSKKKKVTLNGQEVEIKKVTIKPELSRGGGGGGAGGGRGRNNAPWAGYDPWGGGYDGSWGYGAPMNTPWAASYGSGWGGWSSGGSFGGGKLGAGTGGSGYRGGRGGSRGNITSRPTSSELLFILFIHSILKKTAAACPSVQEGMTGGKRMMVLSQSYQFLPFPGRVLRQPVFPLFS
ncbi:HNRNPABD [Lepeophtheirus salmonis]|uniref:HNRNPABD n=1 Tax=Lepeophtheirus salmonis TaxID=72036 RepID=A0A7R8D0P1_LEPSM|nr:HNRNPABD [Lepeophtheirus salmonis]CAF2960888.1 HNRNPABD [Lepeophtheirus salmonis]